MANRIDAIESTSFNGTSQFPARARTEADSAVTPTVFIVEDDINLRDILCLLVRSAGMIAAGYRTAQEFLNDYDPDRPGCVVLDVQLPGMTGVDLQQHLAAAPRSPPVIFLTGCGDVGTATRAMRSGAVDFILKPFDLPVLLARIEEAVELDRNRRRSHSMRQLLDSSVVLLSSREREVMDFLADGQTIKAIASRLGISPKTVDKHRAKVLDKLQVDNSTELANLLRSQKLQPAPWPTYLRN